MYSIPIYVDGQHFQQSMDKPGMVANPARGQLNMEKNSFRCPLSRLRIWSRETRSAIPSSVSLHTQAERGAYSRDSYRFPRRRPFIYLNRHTPSGQFRVNRVPQRTNGVHRRESTGTGPVILEVVLVTGVVFSGFIMDYDQLMCASLFCLCSKPDRPPNNRQK